MEKYALNNNYFRSALWTGKYMQLTLMSIKQGEDVGIEMHENTEQLLIIAQGRGIVTMGNAKENMNFQKRFYDGYAIIIPAGIWHNIVNTGRTPLKIYSVYAPPHHPFGILHETKDDENVRL